MALPAVTAVRLIWSIAMVVPKSLAMNTDEARKGSTVKGMKHIANANRSTKSDF
jgi:hypothetical protein